MRRQGARRRRRVPPPSTPLLAAITPGLDPARRVRWLRALMVVLALVFVMVGMSSFDAVDVIYAVMEGATKLVHGVLPYGHMPPGIIHGDTYPILSYALYMPLALVRSGRNDLGLGRRRARRRGAGSGGRRLGRVQDLRGRPRHGRRAEAGRGRGGRAARRANPPGVPAAADHGVDGYDRRRARGDARRGRAAVAPPDGLRGDARGRRLVQAGSVCAVAGMSGAAPRSPVGVGAGGDRRSRRCRRSRC